MINLFYTDVFFLSLLMFVVTILGNGSMENVVIAAVVMVCGIYAFSRYNFIKANHSLQERKSLLIWILLFFTMYMMYGNFFHAGVDPLGGNDAAFVFLLATLDTLMIISPYSNERLFKLLEYTFFITFIFYVVFFIYLLMSMSIQELLMYRLGNQINGVSVVKGDSNTVAMNIMILSIFMYAKLLVENKRIYALFVLLSMVIIIFTGSKMGIFSIIIYSVTFGIFFSTNRLKHSLLILGMIVALFAIIFSNDYLYLLVGHRIEDFLGMFGLVEHTDYSNSTAIRESMNQVGISMWLDSPIFGNGRAAFRGYSGFQTWSHNNYLEILTSFGIFGLIVNYWYAIVLFIKALYMRNSRDLGIMLVFAYGITSFFMDAVAVRYALYMTSIMTVISGVLVNNAENKTVRKYE